MDSTPPDFGVCRGHNQPETTWCLWQDGQGPSYQVLSEVSKPGHGKGKRQQFSTIPYDWDGLYSTKHYL